MFSPKAEAQPTTLKYDNSSFVDIELTRLAIIATIAMGIGMTAIIFEQPSKSVERESFSVMDNPHIPNSSPLISTKISIFIQNFVLDIAIPIILIFWQGQSDPYLLILMHPPLLRTDDLFIAIVVPASNRMIVNRLCGLLLYAIFSSTGSWLANEHEYTCNIAYPTTRPSVENSRRRDARLIVSDSITRRWRTSSPSPSSISIRTK